MKSMLSIFVMLFFTLTMNAQDVETINRKVDIEKSNVQWTGKKIAGQHAGTIALQSGELEFNKENELIGGTCRIDMTTITCTDLEGDDKTDLEGHLSSADFFGVEDFPIATLVITDVQKEAENSYKVIGELSIKDVTESIAFSTSVIEGEVVATIFVDRTKYGIKYGSGSFFDDLGDKVIDDIFELNIVLVLQ